MRKIEYWPPNLLLFISSFLVCMFKYFKSVLIREHFYKSTYSPFHFRYLCYLRNWTGISGLWLGLLFLFCLVIPFNHFIDHVKFLGVAHICKHRTTFRAFVNVNSYDSSFLLLHVQVITNFTSAQSYFDLFLKGIDEKALVSLNIFKVVLIIANFLVLVMILFRSRNLKRLK